MRHEEKTAIVTGAAQGIGLACAKRFFDEGARVVLADINEVKVTAQAAALDPGGGRTLALGCDVGRRAEVVGLVAAALERFGGLDIMVNNAAISVASEALELSEEDFDRVIAVNLKGALFGCQEAGKAMVGSARAVLI